MGIPFLELGPAFVDDSTDLDEAARIAVVKMENNGSRERQVIGGFDDEAEIEDVSFDAFEHSADPATVALRATAPAAFLQVAFVDDGAGSGRRVPAVGGFFLLRGLVA